MNTIHSEWHNFLRILQKRQQIILIVACGIFGLAVLATLFVTPIYEGTVQIIIERVENDSLAGGGRIQPRDPEYENTQFQLIRSHAVARRVVDMLAQQNALDTSDNSSWFSDLKAMLAGWISRIIPSGSLPEQPEQEAWTVEDRLAAQIATNVRVRPLQGSHITAISYESPDPRLAALTANLYVKAYLEETLDMKMEATRRNMEWMTEKAETERVKLQAAEKKLQSYIEKNSLITLEDRVTILPEQLAQLGRDLVLTESRTKEQKLLYDKVQAVSGDIDAADSVLSISEGGSLDVLRTQILRAEQINRELASKYGAKHPVMLKAEGDLQILKEKHRQEIARIIQKVRNQYELARANENSIRAQLNMIKAETLGLNEKHVQYSSLKREIETSRQLYDALLTKVKDQSITGETRPVNLWVVENAKTPDKPVRPMVMLNLLLGLLIGGCCGIGGAFLVERLDNRIKSPDALDDILGVPTLGSVAVKRRAEVMNEIVRTAPRSEFAESYNALRTTLLLASANAPPKRILITSSIAGEGKSTTAVNLALAMAKTGTRVLLLDGDLRKASLHRILRLPNKVGLSNYLAGNTDEHALLNKSTHNNLTVVTAGPTAPNPYELLNSGRIALLLDRLKVDFDVVICDSPPVLSVSDPRVLSKYFDGTVLVARAGLTTYQMAQKSIRMLQHVNARVLGTFVNGVHASEQEYYRYYSSYLEQTGKTEAAGSRAV